MRESPSLDRDAFAREALALIPKILTLQDRNPHSPTYGCFDRDFWHYRITDFPSGMAQELVWPLALVYTLELPANPFHRQPAVRQWVDAGIRYAARSAHRDGSCDDYFPYERATGASAFSLLACVESYHLLGLRDEALLRFFERRADWLARHQESGRLSNHQALVVLCLTLLARLLQTEKWERAREQRMDRLLAWQSAEGWFPEYDGCDVGYHTLTVSLLARLDELEPTPRLREALARAVRFAAEFVHPDGSFGGEYGSRNTYNFFPHGFELVGQWMREALAVNDRVLGGMAAGRAPCYADDHILGHHAWNYLLAWRDFVADRPPPPPRRAGTIWFEDARLLVDRRDDVELYAALNKGGVFKLFRGGRLVASDTQLSLQLDDGRPTNAVAHLIDDHRVEITAGGVVVAGTFGLAKQTQMTPVRMLALRLVMLSLGRFFPDLARRALQRLLIVGKREAPFAFTRVFTWEAGRWKVTDEVRARSWRRVVGAGIGGDQTSIYVATSRTFQLGQLQSWLDLTDEVRKLAPGQSLRLERWL